LSDHGVREGVPAQGRSDSRHALGRPDGEGVVPDLFRERQAGAGPGATARLPGRARRLLPATGVLRSVLAVPAAGPTVELRAGDGAHEANGDRREPLPPPPHQSRRPRSQRTSGGDAVVKLAGARVATDRFRWRPSSAISPTRSYAMSS